MRKNWSVLKFGGSSVAEARHWQSIIEIVRKKQAEGKAPLLVLSALKSVSNALEALLHQSIAGVYSIGIQRLQELHYGFAARLGVDGEQLLEQKFKQLQTQCKAIYQQQRITPRDHASVLVYGELFSTILGSAYLNKNAIDSTWLDARELLTSTSRLISDSITDNVIEEDLWHHFLSAECDYGFDEELSEHLMVRGGVIVTQGFIARDGQGESVLLGREGSDTSASYLAAIVGADEIEIWTDVPGFFSSNPREVLKAKQIRHLSYVQARRMAAFGAKILHPRAIKPAQEYNIPISVKCISESDNPGTLICVEQPLEKKGVFAVVTQHPVTFVEGLSTDACITHLLMGLGYDVLIQDEDENNPKLVLCFANSTQPEPEEKDFFKLFHEFTSKKETSINFKSGMLTLIGQPEGKWFQQVEKLLDQADLFQIYQSFVFPEVGRFSFLLPQNTLHAALEFFHEQLIN